MGILEQMRLDGKVAFVTGGARGIGRAIAEGLAESGACVAIVDLDYEAAAEMAKALGSEHMAIQTDVTEEQSVKTMMEQILSRYQRLDIAVCNAGICLNAPAEEMTYAQFKKIIDVNLNGVFLTAQAAAKVMLKQGRGSIINTASMSGHIVNVPQPQCAYNASKAAVIMLTKSMAVEFAKRNVRVNSISPGYIGTDLVLKAEHLQPLIKQWNEMSPIGRLGKAEELKAIAVYLAGDTSDFTTGADFIVDGGFTCF